MEELRCCFSALLACKKRISEEKFIFNFLNIFHYTFPFVKEINLEKHYPISQSKQRLQKSHLLQKLGRQKPFLDQATLSSLVNKQVTLTLFLKIVQKMSKL